MRGYLCIILDLESLEDIFGRCVVELIGSSLVEINIAWIGSGEELISAERSCTGLDNEVIDIA